MATHATAQNSPTSAHSSRTASGTQAATAKHRAQKAPEQRRGSASSDIPQNDTEALLAQERAAVAGGDPSQIEIAAQKLIASALRHVGDLRILDRKYDEGTKAYEAALSLQDDSPTRLKLGIAYLRLKRRPDAIAQADRVIAADAENAEAWKLKGNALAESDDYPQAAQTLAHALKLRGENDTAYTLAICFLQMKELSKARLVFDDLEKHVSNRAALHIVEGHAYRDAALTDLAIAQYKKALAINPKIANAHYFIALTTLMLHEWDTSDPAIEQEFRAEIGVNPNSFLANYMLGWVAWHRREYDVAEPVLKRAAEISPNLPEPPLYLGLIAFERNDYPSAEPLLRKAIELTGNDDARNFYQIRRAYIAMGRILARKHSEVESTAMFNKARDLQELSLKQSQQHVSKILATGGPAPMGAMVPLETKTTGGEPVHHIPDEDDLAAKLSPDQQKEATEEQAYLGSIIASSYNDFATAEAKSGHFSEALGHFREAEKWNPDIPGLQRNIGIAAMKMEDYAGAIPALEKQLTSQPEDGAVRAMLGVACFAQGKYRESAETLNGLGDALLQDLKLTYTFGAALARSGQIEQARNILNRLPLDQLAPDMLVIVGQAYADAHDFDKAISLFHRASELQPTLVKAHYDAGLAYLLSDRPAPAQKEFENELALVPDDLNAKYNLAFTLLQQSEHDRARQLLQQVTAADPSHADAQYQLGKMLLDEGDANNAVVHLELAAKNAPNKDYIHYQLQQAYRKVSRPQDAERELAIYKQLKERANLTSESTQR